MPAEKLSLHRKLAQVMYEAERIPKNGTAPREMGGYKFVQVGDAADYIRKALAEKVITMIPTSIEVLGEVEHATAKGGTMTTYTIRMEWTITDGESGESIVVPSIGVGSDTGDKFASKATSSAMKYALLSGFLLSTGDDSEGSNLPERVAPRQVGELRPTLERRTNDENGLVGKVATVGTQDFQLRETPEGWVLPFRLKDAPNRAGQIVMAHDAIAQALAPFRDTLIGKNVTVWGRYTDEETPPNAKGEIFGFTVLHVERIATPDFILPPPPADSPLRDTLTVSMGLVEPITDEEAAAIVAAEKAEALA